MKKKFAVVFFQALAVCIALSGFMGYSVLLYPQIELYGLQILLCFFGAGAVIFILAMIAGKDLKIGRLSVARVIGIVLCGAVLVAYVLTCCLMYRAERVSAIMIIVAPLLALALSAATALLCTVGRQNSATEKQCGGSETDGENAERK